MFPLRQRLLLVVGWVVAAVGTGLVSAGAVAVAGGQVADRPLRPLSAAEVAALPVTIEEDCVTSGPLASGGSDGAPCSVALGDDTKTNPVDDSTQPTERELDELAAELAAVGANEVPLLPPADPAIASGPQFPSPEDDDADGISVELDGPLLTQRPGGHRVIDLIGGEVRITVTDSGLVLTGAFPHPGYVVDALFTTTDQLTVTFWNGSRLSAIVATLTDQGLFLNPTES